MKAGWVREQELTSEKSWQQSRYGAAGMGFFGRLNGCTSFGQGLMEAQKRTVLRALGVVPMAWMDTSNRTDASIGHV